MFHEHKKTDRLSPLVDGEIRIYKASVMEIRIDIDAEKQKAATQDERQEFLTALFWVTSQATADYGAHVDFSDAHHWVITFPDEYEPQVSALFAAQKRIGESK